MAQSQTAFFFDERCLWHFGAPHALFFPVGGWVQPPSSEGYAESPDTKRRLKSLMDVSGLTAALRVSSAAPADRAAMLRFIRHLISTASPRSVRRRVATWESPLLSVQEVSRLPGCRPDLR